MEDKWLIFLEDEHLYFHRSWTGKCIYRLRLEEAASGYAVREALVNRNPDDYNGADDDHDVALLGFLIDNFLLDQQTPFPLPADAADSVPGTHQHHFAGTGTLTVDHR